MVKREHRHFLFMQLGMCLCPGLSRHINLALDLFALQRLKYYFQFFHEIPLQIERTSSMINIYVIGLIVFGLRPRCHIMRYVVLFYRIQKLTLAKYISNYAKMVFFHEVVYLYNVKILF